jgi:hypothetical protein
LTFRRPVITSIVRRGERAALRGRTRAIQLTALADGAPLGQRGIDPTDPKVFVFEPRIGAANPG